MLFDVQAALAEILGSDTATPATPATPAPKIAAVSQMSRVSQSRQPVARGPIAPSPAPPLAAVSARPLNDGDAFPHGVCRFTGRPRTWTGKVVSLDDWRQLSPWDREGPAGRVFCGLCRAWVTKGGGCREAGCWNGPDGG